MKGESGWDSWFGQRTSLRRRVMCASFDVFVAIASVFSERSSAISKGDAKSVRNVM